MDVKKESPMGSLLLMCWNGILDSSEVVLGYTKWTLTGVAATTALITANLESVSQVISHGWLKGGLSLLVASILSGFISFAIVLWIHSGHEMKKRMAENLSQGGEVGEEQARDIDRDELKDALVAPFWGPLRYILSRSFRFGFADPWYHEKFQLFLVSLSSIVMPLHLVLAGAGLIVLICGIK